MNIGKTILYTTLTLSVIAQLGFGLLPPTPALPPTQSLLVKARKSVVRLANANGTSGGSGAEVLGTKTKTPYVITNYHVCDSYINSTITAKTDVGEHLVKVLFYDKEHDLCLTTSSGTSVLPVSDSPPGYYDTVLNVGHPYLKPASPSIGMYLGRDIVGVASPFKGSCEPGQEEAQDFFSVYCVQREELDLTTTVIYPGNSGSPALNTKGELIGVFNSGDDRTNHGNMVPLEFVKNFLKDK